MSEASDYINNTLNMQEKSHLEDGDKLVWYKDSSIVATWHSNGKVDIFEKESVSISDANFRIIKGHWRKQGEHTVGKFPEKWMFNDKPISEYTKLNKDFWNPIKTEKSPVAKTKKQSEKSDVKAEQHKNIVRVYKYESEKYLFGSNFSELYSEQLRKESEIITIVIVITHKNSIKTKHIPIAKLPIFRAMLSSVVGFYFCININH